MSEEIKNELEKKDEWNSVDPIWIFLLLTLFGGLGNSENPRINELEKKVARLEGQMSMIGGKFHE